MMKLNKLAAAAVMTALLGFASSVAMASTLTDTRTFNNVKEVDLNFAGFDASLGTLTGVTALVTGTATLPDGSVSGTTEAYDNGDEAENIFNIFSASPGAELEVLGLITLSDIVTVGSTVECETENSGENCTANYFSETLPFSAQGTASSVAGFDAPLVLEFNISTVLETYLGVATSDPTSMWHASGSLSLAYEYEPVQPVPLPAGGVLLLTALAGFSALKRRKKVAA